MTYFHCAPQPLGIGSIIEPGNWGRIIRLYEPDNKVVSVQALNEACLEYARRLHAPTAPSRLDCVFALPDIDSAKNYAFRHSPRNIIYEIEPMDRNAAMHIGDYEVSIEPHTDRYFDKIFDRGLRYWTTENPSYPEVLFACPIRVISQIYRP